MRETVRLLATDQRPDSTRSVAATPDRLPATSAEEADDCAANGSKASKATKAPTGSPADEKVGS